MSKMYLSAPMMNRISFQSVLTSLVRCGKLKRSVRHRLVSVLAHPSSSAASLPREGTAPLLLGCRALDLPFQAHPLLRRGCCSLCWAVVIIICVQEGRLQPKPAVVSSEINP